MSQKSPVEPPASTAPARFLNGNGKSAFEAQHERRVLTALSYDLSVRPPSSPSSTSRISKH